jgi:hypothetical protein
MYWRLDPRRWWRLPATVVLLWGACTLPASAQELGTKAEVEDGFSPDMKQRFRELVAGTKQFSPKDHGAIPEKAAKYYIYPVTWVTVRNAKNQQESGFPNVHKRFRDVMEDAAKGAKNEEFMRAFCKALNAAFKEVFAQKLDGNTPAVTNAALMLPIYGKCRQDEAADFLGSIINDPKEYHAFVRMCAVKGLGDTFPAMTPKQLDNFAAGDDKVLAEKRDLYVKRLETVMKYISNPLDASEYPAIRTPEHDDAFYFLRREGVKALAQFQVPALGVDAKNSNVIGPAAFYLALMFNRDKQTGKYLLLPSERLEAALGLCQLNVAEVPQYRADVGLYLVGMTLVDLANEYNADIPYFGGKGKAGETPRQSKLPWKAVAGRMDAGLQVMIANLGKDSDLGKKASQLRANVDQMLKTMANHKEIGPPIVLGQFVENQLRPQSWEIYVGNKNLVITPPVPAGAQ